MSWTMQGEFFENCSCDAICPCTWSNMARPATYDDCRFALAFQVERGDIEGTDVSGRTFVLVAQTPRLMPEGNWKLGVLIDDGASEEQVGALGRVLGGELGGPPAAVAPFLGEFLGIEQLPITITNDGRRHHVQAGQAIDYSGERMLTPDGDAVSLTNIVVHPAGPTLGLAPVDRVNNNAFGIDWSGEGRSGFANRFAWSA